MFRKWMILTFVATATLALAMPLGVGSKIPNISLVKVGGRVKLAETVKKATGTVLYFWSFEAGADPDDFVLLQTYYQTVFKGLDVVAVCVNGTDIQADQWKKENGFTYHSTADNSSNGTTARLFGVKRFPVLFVVNHEGMITHRFDKVEETKLRAAIEGLGVEVKDGQE